MDVDGTKLKMLVNVKRLGFDVPDHVDVVEWVVSTLVSQRADIRSHVSRGAIVAQGVEDLTAVLKELVAAHHQALQSPRPHGGRWHDHASLPPEDCQGCMHERVQARAQAAMRNWLARDQDIDTSTVFELRALIHETQVFSALLRHQRRGRYALVDGLLQELLKHPRDYERIRLLMED